MKYEYEAISGDQSLFELVGAKPHHGFILKMFGDAGNIITSAEKLVSGWESLAERKVKELNLPVVGDKCESLHNKAYDCIVAYTNEKYLTLEFSDKSLTSKSIKDFYLSYKIIDQSKQPNPVNMVEGKWVPGLQEKFKVEGSDIIYTCVDDAYAHILGRGEMLTISSFAKNTTKFTRA